MYESESKVVEPWVDSPGEVSREDWRDYLGRREYVWVFFCSVLVKGANLYHRYQRAFVNYFEDELVHHGYDWKSVVNDYLFEGNEPMFNSIIADRMYLPVW